MNIWNWFDEFQFSESYPLKSILSISETVLQKIVPEYYDYI